MDEGRLCDIKGCGNPQCPGCEIEVSCSLTTTVGDLRETVKFAARAHVCRPHHEYFTQKRLGGLTVSPAPYSGIPVVAEAPA